MKTDDYYLDLIEKYIERKDDQETQVKFEEELRKDQTLANMYQKYLEAEKVLELSAGQLLKEKLQAMQVQNQPKASIPLWRYGLLAAAVVALIIMIAGLGWKGDQVSREEMLETYIQAYAAGPSRSMGEKEGDWEMAAQAYSLKDYNAAIQLFNQIKPENPRFIESRFFMGNAAVLAGEYSVAIPALKQVIEAKDVRFSNAAQWYLVLATFGMENETESKTLAKKILNDPGHPYRDISRDFLHDLDAL